MSMFKIIVTVLGCALLFAIFPVQADQWDKKTIMTFSQPVEIPGVVLPAGTYVFKLASSDSNRHIVQVFNEDQTRIFATILAIPDYRLEPTGETVVRFEERPKHLPEALQAWFYPGDNFGQAFVYPKRRAMQLAEATRQPVLAAEVTPTQPPEELKRAPIVAITPERKEVEVAQVVQPKPAETPAQPGQAPAPPPAAAPVQTLPKTASPTPLVALLGLASLGVAGVLKVVRRLL